MSICTYQRLAPRQLDARPGEGDAEQHGQAQEAVGREAEGLAGVDLGHGDLAHRGLDLLDQAWRLRVGLLHLPAQLPKVHLLLLGAVEHTHLPPAAQLGARHAATTVGNESQVELQGADQVKTRLESYCANPGMI